MYICQVYNLKMSELGTILSASLPLRPGIDNRIKCLGLEGT